MTLTATQGAPVTSAALNTASDESGLLAPMTSGMEDLLAAFDAAESPPAAATGTEQVPNAEEAAPAETPAQPQQAESAQPRTAPPPDVLQEKVDEGVRTALSQLDQARQAQAYQQWLNSLSNEQYGQVARQWTQQQAQWQTAQNAAMNHFFKASTQDVVAAVKELQSLTPEAAAALDPRKFDSIGEMYGAWIDHVATARATSKVEKLAQEKFEAYKTQYEKDVANKTPQPTPTGGGLPPSGAPRYDRASGDELLEYGFRK